MSGKSAVILAIMMGGLSLGIISGQKEHSPQESILDLLNAFQELLPYHLAYGQQVLSQPVAGSIVIDQTKSWKENLKEIEASLDLQSRIVGDQLILFPKKRFLVHGFIYDEKTGESLPGAHLFIPENQTGAVSNETGYFQVWLPEGQVQIVISYLGYSKKIHTMEVRASGQLDVRLQPALDLPEVIVQVTEEQDSYNSSLSAANIPLRSLNDFPSLTASMDIARYLQLTPGITTGSDGLGGFHVRGGNADQNQILLEGIPIYNPFHLFGVSSIINSDAIQKADLFKSYFPPEYSGRLSSVLNVVMRDGHRQQPGIQTSAGLLGVHAVLETPIFRNRGTLMLAGQRSHAGNILQEYSRTTRVNEGNDGYFKPKFWDFYGKAMLFLGQSDKLILNAYSGSDTYLDINRYLYENPADTGFNDQYRDEYYWGNRAAGMKWLHNFNGRVFMKINFYHSQYSYHSINAYSELILLNQQQINGLRELTEFRSSISETGLSSNFSLLPGLRHQVETGLTISWQQYTPGIIAYGDETGNNPLFSIDNDLPRLPDYLFDTLAFNSSQIRFFAEERWDISDSWKVEGGVTSTLFYNVDENFISFQPRIHITYRHHKHMFGFSGNKLFQAQHLISARDNGLPNELWVPATGRIRPQRSWNADISWSWNRSDNILIHSSIYYKKMLGLVGFKDDPGYLSFGHLDNVDASVWESDVVTGEGTSWGIENSLEYSGKRMGFNLNYTFARSSRFFPDKYQGYVVPYEFEIPHNFKFFGMWKVSPKIKLGFTWQISSGTRYNLNPGSYDLYDRAGFFLENFTVEENGLDLLIMPVYHRLDLAGIYETGNESIRHRFKFSLLNIYDRRNGLLPRIYQGDPTEIRLGEGLPLIPSLSYHFSMH